MEGVEEDHKLPAPGTLFAGRYRIERVLGAGGMGCVMLARHEVIGQHVALKLLHPEAASNPSAVERFVKEARAASKIEGQHVVRIYDVGTEDGRPYLCMEYLRGRDLGQVFDAQGPLPSHEVCTALLDAIVALAQAHEAGIVHRDLKPSNLFFAEQPAGKPVLKVLDFGIAKMEEGLGSIHATSTGMIMGTPAYMAPEQMRSSKMVDARADIWALGVIGYELLTGRLPYLGESLGDILFAIVEKPPPAVHEIRPEIDPALSAVVARCLQRDPNKRYATVHELAEALEPFAAVSRHGQSAALRMSISGELHARPSTGDDLGNAKTEQLPSGPMANPKTVSEWVTESHVRPKRQVRRIFAVGAVLVLAGVGLAFGRGAFVHSSAPLVAGGSPSVSALTGELATVPHAPALVSDAAAPSASSAPSAPATSSGSTPSSAASSTPSSVVASSDGRSKRSPLPTLSPVVHPGASAHPTPTPTPAATPVVATPAAPKPADTSGMTSSKDWDSIPGAKP